MRNFFVTLKVIRFIWHLGFSSGRVQQAAHPNTGITWDEETPLFEKDLIRLASANKKLSQDLQAAQQGFAPDAASLSAPDDTTGAFDDSIIGSLP